MPHGFTFIERWLNSMSKSLKHQLYAPVYDEKVRNNFSHDVLSDVSDNITYNFQNIIWFITDQFRGENRNA